jgi:hypothetical protein
MKPIRIFLITITFLIQSISLLHAQTTSGTDFWITFGKNYYASVIGNLDLQIRIVNGNQHNTGGIYFTNLNTWVYFDIAPQQVYTYNLILQKAAVYNLITGKSNYSIHITSDYLITVYALNQTNLSTDATNILPLTALGTEYYQLSYRSINSAEDAYAVVATENNTNLYHNGALVPGSPFNAGEVYYRTAGSGGSDMTGSHITANNPVAFFAVNQGVYIPVNISNYDCLFQQLAPVNTWGYTFFVPVSHLAKDRVRIVASQDGTNITQTGGIHISAPGGQTGPTYTLNAGQFIELEALLTNNGCYIQANTQVGVCSYLVGSTYNGMWISDPAQCWIPAIEQTVTEALIAPFIPTGVTALNKHYALVVTPTVTQTNTKVSIGGAPPVALSGDIWHDNAVGMSFYTMQLTNPSASYLFTNNEGGLLVMCYGIGGDESYYYLGSSAMRNLDAAFYVNNVHYQNLQDTTFCAKDVYFRANIEGLHADVGSLKWYIDGVEEVAARDQLQWSKPFETGVYEIKMWVRYENDETTTIQSVLKMDVFWVKIRNIRY